jgi:hypothetical protein
LIANLKLYFNMVNFSQRPVFNEFFDMTDY